MSSQNNVSPWLQRQAARAKEQNNTINAPKISGGAPSPETGAKAQPSDWLFQQVEQAARAKGDAEKLKEKQAAAAPKVTTSTETGGPSQWLQQQVLRSQLGDSKYAGGAQILQLERTRNQLQDEVSAAQRAYDAATEAEYSLTAGFSGSPYDDPEYTAKMQAAAQASADAWDALYAAQNKLKKANDDYTYYANMQKVGALSAEDRASLEDYAKTFKLQKQGFKSIGTNIDGTKGYFALKNKGYSHDEIYAMAETLARYNSAEEAEKRKKEAEAFAKEHEILGTIGSWGAQFAGGITGGVEMLGQGLSSALGISNYEVADPNAAGFAPGQWANTVQQTVVKEIEGENPNGWQKAGSYAYQALNSAVNSGLTIGAGLLTGGGSTVTSALFFTSAAQADFQAKSAAGYSANEAFLSGIVSGALEMATEKYSVDNLLSLKKPTSWIQVLKNAAIQGGVEVIEEELNFAAGILADGIIHGADSPDERRVRQIMQEQNVSEEAARKQLFKEHMLEAADTAITSFMSGSMMAGISGSAQKLSGDVAAKKDQQPQIATQGGENAQQTQTSAPGNSPVVTMPGSEQAASTTETDGSAQTDLSTNAVSKPLGSYPAEKQNMIMSYAKAVDEKIKSFVQRVKSGDLSFKRQKISDVSARAATDIGNLLGIDVSGYTHNINTNGVQHILNRHGENGAQDKSMSLEDDIARVGWVLENYDSVDLLTEDGNQIYSSEFLDKNHEKAPQIRFVKKIDGSYYVVEAAFENDYKKLWVQSAYLQKKEDVTRSPAESQAANHETNARSAIVSPSSNNNVSQTPPDVKTEVAPQTAQQIVNDILDGVYEKANGVSGDPVAAAVESFRTTGTVTNKQVEHILGTAKGVTSFLQQTGVKLDGLTASQKRQAVKDGIAKLAQETAVDTAENTDYDNGIEQGGAVNGTGEAYWKIQDYGGTSRNDPSGNAGTPAENGDRSGIQGTGRKRHETLGRDTGVRPEEVSGNEKAALLAYKSGGSYLLNAKLREDIELDESEQNIVNGVDGALEKLPAYRGTVYRNLIFDDFGGQEALDGFLANHAIGEIVTYPAFTSTSSQQDGYPVEGSLPVHIEIEGVTGKNVDGFGNNFEKEILFARGTQFKVTGIRYDQNGTPIIYLTEVADEGLSTHGGRNQEAHSGNRRGQQNASAQSHPGEVQRLPEERAGRSEMQFVSKQNSKGNSGEQGVLRGVRAEVTSGTPANESVGAADANFTGKQAYYDLLSDDNVKPGREGDVRDVEVPETDGYGRRVSDFATNAVGAEVTTDEMAGAIEELIGEGALGFDIKHDKELFEAAAAEIKKDKLAGSRNKVTKAAMGSKAKDSDIAKALLLYNIYNSKGDIDNASEIMVDLAAMANDAGRKLRLFGLLRKMTPEGQRAVVEKSVQRSIERINKGRSERSQTEVTIPDELLEAYEDAARRDSYEHSEESARAKAEAEAEIYKAAAAQIKASPMEKLNAWRYMAMLGNAKTQIRNFFGNAMFRPLVSIKRAVGAAIESVTLEQKDRTKAVLGFGKDASALVSWAQEDAKGQTAQELLSYCGQTGDAARSAIDENRQIYDTKWLEAVREFVQKVPEQADMFFKKREYAVSLASFLKAKGYTSTDIQSGKVSQEILTEGRAYAAQEALKATFNDQNALSDLIVNLRYKGNNKALQMLNLLGEGVMPFRRTPANIVVRGMDYSPIGLVRGIGNAALNVRSGKVSAATAIDQIAGGLTGTGMMALGWALASGLFGSIRLRGKVDEEEKLSGHQSYALEIGNQSYDISWLAPSNIPLLVGANLYELGSKNGNEDNWLVNAASATVTALEPLLELSCLSSLNDLIESVRYSGDGEALYAIAASAATSYLTQFIPTLLGQTEQAFEDTKKTTYSNADTPLERSMEKTIGRITQKIPVVDLFQTEKVDKWGRTQEKEAVQKAFDAFINPSKVTTIEETDADRELERLRGTVPDENVYPGSFRKEISYTDDKGVSHTKVLTAEEYVTLAKAQGQRSRELVEEIIGMDDYKGLTDAEKAKVISRVYDYAAAVSKSTVVDYHEEPSWITNRAEGMSIAEAIIRQEVVGTTKMYADLPLKQAVYIAGVFDRIEKEKKADGTMYSSVRTVQKVESLAGSTLSEEQQKDVMDDILDDGAYEKYVKILEAGYDTDDYAAAYRLYQDTEKTKYVGKKEMTIRSFMEEFGVSRSAAKALYEIYAGKDD